MKRILIFILLFLVSYSSFSQFKIGVFKNVKAGLTLNYFYNFKGDYVYILQQNARVVERTENKQGAMLSAVIIFPLASEEDQKKGKHDFNFLLNLPILDFQPASSEAKTDVNFFNKQATFGVGMSVFPFKSARCLGFSIIGNLGTQKRLRKDAIDVKYFPIADYPSDGLAEGAPVPDNVLERYYKKETTYSVSGGIIIRL